MTAPVHARHPIALAALCFCMASPAYAQSSGGFQLGETSIDKIRSAVVNKTVSCERIVSSYLDRISRFDKSGARPINAIIAINPLALAEARKLDSSPPGTLGPLACAPLIIKDNIDVAGMPTTAGSRALADNIADDDATQVARLRAAGAIVIAKSNLAEFAWTPDYSDSSLGGLTRNPYDTARTTGGSSGGTAAAVAADFGVAGLGTDTGASIRGPSALQNLVGLRPTLGASSRNGVIPITLTRDTVGPMTKTVPAITVPMGDTDGHLPTGLQFGGRPFSEAVIVGAAYAYEQASHHRTPPPLPVAELK